MAKPNTDISLQEKFAPKSICFGCGPANVAGLHIRSIAPSEQSSGDGEVRATWTPRPEYRAFPGVLNGGIIGALLDCHCNWTAAWGLMTRDGLDHPPCTVTAEYTIKLLRPTPVDGPVELIAKVAKFEVDRAWIEGELRAGGKTTAKCTGLFVAVKEGHPAFFRW